MFQLLIQTLLFNSHAHALTPPNGWVALGDGHAVREAGQPAKGELIELSVAGDIVSLGFALMDSSIAVQDSKKLDTGSVSLSLDDGRIGEARYLNEKWVVLLHGVNEPIVADVVFSAIRFDDKATPWGQKAKDETGWNPSAGEEWKVEPRIAGTWVCASMVKGQPIKLKIVLDADGSVTWEEKRSGDVQIKRGQWLASSDSLGIEFDSQTMFVDYEIFQGGLEIRYDNNNFKLLPR
ncbi:MAG: hypothetical protein ACON4U_06460 [Myxococcota bacterium]